MDQAARLLPLTDAMRRRSLTAVIMSCFGVGLAFGLGYPLTTMALEARGEPSWIIGLAGAAPSLAILALMPFLPYTVARISPATAIIGGCLCCAACYISLYFITSTTAWIVLRFIMGGTIALPWIVGETWINMIAEEHRRARIISLYAVSFFSGFAVGPLLLELLGTDGIGAFAVGAGGSMLAAVPIYLSRYAAPNLAHEPATGLIGGMLMAPAAMAGSFLGGFLETSHFALLPTVAMAGGWDEGNALRLLSVLVIGGLLTQYGIGWLADRTSRRGLLAALGLLYVALIAAFPYSLQHPDLAYVLIFLMGTAVISFYTLGLAMLGQEVSPSQLATGNAAFIFIYTTGGIIGPATTGAAMSMGPTAGFVGTTAAAALCLTAVIAFARGRI